jgi:hypothetical protein
MVKGHNANRIPQKSKPAWARHALIPSPCDAIAASSLHSDTTCAGRSDTPSSPVAHSRPAAPGEAASRLPALCRRFFRIFAAVFAIPPKLSLPRNARRLWPKTACEAQPYAPAIPRAALLCVSGRYTSRTSVHSPQVPCLVRPGGARRRVATSPVLRINRPPVPPWFRSFYRGGDRRPTLARRRDLSFAARRVARPGAAQATGNNSTCAEEVWKFRREDRGPRRLPNAR